MSKGISTLAVYIALALVDILFIFFFAVEVVPLLYPSMVKGSYWLLWPTSGVFGSVIIILITYVWMKIINYEYKQWKQSFLIAIIFFISVTALAYVFDKILPFEFEPFRSLVLPAMIFTIIFVIFARFRYPQKTDSSL